MTSLRRLRTTVLAALVALVLTACDFSVYNLPLPGGPSAGEDPMEVTVQFADVLDLVPQSTVKVNDVSVGQVTDIALDGYAAEVTVEIRRGLDLPDNAVAKIRQTSLLGEKFVSLEPPASDVSSQPLQDGDVIPLDRTGRNPEVEEVLGALSLLLNGGGVAQLQTITKELNNALEGREGAAKSVLRQISSFMGQLDDNKRDIVRAIENLNRLAISIRKEQPTIDAALEELPSALDSIDRQRDDLVKMLRALNDLSDVGTRVIRASKTATIDSLELLDPVLTKLAESGDNFTKAFHVFLTYPFVDEVVGRDPQVARNLHMGDYTNLSIRLDLNIAGGNLVEGACMTLQDVREQLGDGEQPLQEALQQLDGLDDLCQGAAEVIETCLAKDGLGGIATCLQNRLGADIAELTQDTTEAVCTLAPALCDRLGLGGGGGSGGSGGGTGGSGGDGGSDGPLDGTLDGLGLGRAGVGDLTAGAGSRGTAGSGPTVGELMETYDPALVSLLVPGVMPR
jgi:phospholipid/cholesterol/gamma-HCH transport system substrate-binding protein